MTLMIFFIEKIPYNNPGIFISLKYKSKNIIKNWFSFIEFPISSLWWRTEQKVWKRRILCHLKEQKETCDSKLLENHFDYFKWPRIDSFIFYLKVIRFVAISFNTFIYFKYTIISMLITTSRITIILIFGQMFEWTPCRLNYELLILKKQETIEIIQKPDVREHNLNSEYDGKILIKRRRILRIILSRVLWDTFSLCR